MVANKYTLKRIILDITTTASGDMCSAKVGGWVAFIIITYMEFHNCIVGVTTVLHETIVTVKQFDVIGYTESLCKIIAAVGAAIWMKRSDEPPYTAPGTKEQ